MLLDGVIGRICPMLPWVHIEAAFTICAYVSFPIFRQFYQLG